MKNFLIVTLIGSCFFIGCQSNPTSVLTDDHNPTEQTQSEQKDSTKNPMSVTPPELQGPSFTLIKDSFPSSNQIIPGTESWITYNNENEGITIKYPDKGDYKVDEKKSYVLDKNEKRIDFYVINFQNVTPYGNTHRISIYITPDKSLLDYQENFSKTWTEFASRNSYGYYIFHKGKYYIFESNTAQKKDDIFELMMKTLKLS